MKRITAFILSIFILGLGIPAAFAAGAEINDGLADDSMMYWHSDNMVFESTTKLGTYDNPVYATSDAGRMEAVYKLDSMACVEVTTLNYRNTEDISFYASADNVTYTDITEFTRTAGELSSTWTKTNYEAVIAVENAQFFKIVINQTKAKYIRLDCVRIMTMGELICEDYCLLRDNARITGDNIYGADTLVLTFNQNISEIPGLTITADSGKTLTAEGNYADEKNVVIYKFDTLLFDVYKFCINGIKSLGGAVCDVNIRAGAKVVFVMPEAVHFGEYYTTDSFIAGVENFQGDRIIAGDIAVTSLNEDIIAINGNIFELKKGGDAVLNIVFRLDDVDVLLSRRTRVCNAVELAVSPGALMLSKDEDSIFKAEARLDDGTTAPVQNITAAAVDDTIAEVSGNTIKGIGVGSTFINVSADYYGTELKAVISVGVGKAPLEVPGNAEIGVNRNEIVVGESIYATVKGSMENGEEVDPLSIIKDFHSDNEAVAVVAPDGKITAIGEGKANIYADISIGGVHIRTNSVDITVSADEIARVELVLPAYYILTGRNMDIGVRAYTKRGTEIENPDIRYKVAGSAFSVAEDVLTAKAAGEGEISAVVTHHGKQIESKKIRIAVVNGNGEVGKDFTTDSNWNGVFEYSDRLMVLATHGVLPISGSDGNQYVTFKSEQEITALRMSIYHLNDRQADDIQFWVSADNSNYVRIPESKMTVKTENTEGAWWTEWFTYSGDLLKGARYVKAVLDSQYTNDDGRHADAMRLLRLYMEHDTVPEVVGVSQMDRNGFQTWGANTSKLVVSFSQAMDPETFSEVVLQEKDSGKVVNTQGVYHGNTYTMTFDSLKNVTHTLFVSGAKNMHGTAMERFSYDLPPGERSKVTVSDINMRGETVSARLTNNTNDVLNAVVITVIYDSNGYMQEVHSDAGVEIPAGVTNYTAGSSFSNRGTARVYVWTDMNNISVY